jgi:hypothetical protein
MSLETHIDSELEAVGLEIRKLDPNGLSTGRVLRDTLDQLYDGQRTGRYRFDQLFKTEKTHCGTLVEINLQREFGFADGTLLDYKIGGIEVDCKYSQTLGGWMIPPEARQHICLILWAEDSDAPKWSMGLVRVTDENLNSGGNRDLKSTLNAAGRNSIQWLFKDAPLPPNVLLQLDRKDVDRIMAQKSGQQRINELFRSALCRIVSRAVVATVAIQDDYMKRVRTNGGARTALQKEGIIILGQYDSHARIAQALGVPAPSRGDSVSVRVVQTTNPGDGVAQIGDKFWIKARPNDPVERAPDLPKIQP